MQLILASTSPRRRALLALLGVPFEVCSPSFEERSVPGLTPTQLVVGFARGKARAVADAMPEAWVIGSDTLIELDGEALGKPCDLAEARAMLRRLAGREHSVHTAVSLTCSARAVEDTGISTALVRMKPFDAKGHERYLSTGDSLGKAGGYSIQGGGAALIESLTGDYPTVVGLPLRIVADMLRRAGLTLPIDIDRIYSNAEYENWAQFKAESSG